MTRATIQFAYQLLPPEHLVDEQSANETSATDVLRRTSPGIADELMLELSAWRSILHKLELFGQNNPEDTYGSMSVRLADDRFAISVHQSGGFPELSSEQWTTITSCNLDRSWVDAQGHEPPSSDTLTHAAAYLEDTRIRCLLIARSVDIWQARETLNLPQIPLEFSTGSAGLARAARGVIDQYQSRPLLILCAASPGTVIACGSNVRDCASLLVHSLAKARIQKS